MLIFGADIPIELMKLILSASEAPGLTLPCWPGWFCGMAGRFSLNDASAEERGGGGGGGGGSGVGSTVPTRGKL